ncbi:hypothetical protein TNCT_192261 [Trichonephila clavata]|uniref:Uncharacterized protein n=1 Tax=Trichonephila clavata TaxID=2740835 RepID=A0A8X6G1S2_TRICU|nr:hypothetical protein TNCT_192261 [Trichonephila clavata]
MQNFLRKIDEHSGTSYKKLSQSYLNVEKMVNFIDTQLSSFVFWVTIYVAITMYLTISYIFHSNTFLTLIDLCSLLNSGVCFLTATTSAAFVFEASELVQKSAKAFPKAIRIISSVSGKKCIFQFGKLCLYEEVLSLRPLDLLSLMPNYSMILESLRSG